MSESSECNHDNHVTQRKIYFLRGLFVQYLQEIRHAIITDSRMPQPGWETPYRKIIEICMKCDKNTGQLTDALTTAVKSIECLNNLAEQELSELQTRINFSSEEMENVREMVIDNIYSS
jgi:hypothetical protein